MGNPLFPTRASTKVNPVWPTLHELADEGALYIATNPTPGTAIATTTSVVDAGNSGATSAQTRPVAIWYNSATASDQAAKNIYPLYLSMTLGQVPTSATAWEMAMWLDPVGASAYTSGGSQITPVGVNPDVSTSTRLLMYFGAITAAATTSGARLVCRRKINPAIPVTLDDWMFVFGGPTGETNVLSGGASVKRVTFPMPPLVIPPGYALKMGMWGAANAAAPTWEFEMLYAERTPGL